MTPFALAIGKSQSADCKTLTVWDNSNWTSNTQNYIKANSVRKIKFLDADGVLLQPETTLSNTIINVNLPMTVDLYVEVVLTVSGEVSGVIQSRFFLSCYFNKKAAQLTSESKCGCGCDDTKGECEIARARNRVFSAVTHATYGAGKIAQELLTSANDILNDLNP